MSDSFRINEQIQSKSVRVINQDGSQAGILLLSEAMELAKSQGLDLIEITAEATPPVCKIFDYGKFKYEREKKAKEARRASAAARVTVKEIYMRPVTGENDILIKAKQAKRFLEDGDRVKIVIKFRGREITHIEEGRKVFQTFINEVGEHQFVQNLKMSDNQLMAIISKSEKK